MLASLKSDFRKLLTVRSTYLVIVLALALIGFISFYVSGYRDSVNYFDKFFLNNGIFTWINTMGVFIAIVTALQMGHEYRYSTIMYTLTSSGSRSQTLLSKIVVSSVFAVAVVAITVVFGAVMQYLGALVAGHHPEPQHFQVAQILWRGMLYGWFYAMIGLVLAVLFRQIVAIIVTLFLVPSTVEPLLSLLLKDNAKYLPFTALDPLINNSSTTSTGHAALSPGRGAMTFGIYLAVLWIVTWIVFLKRDATN
jgi:ABC-type transport system involved in multi-copper enzyme maturation permease subunit